MTARGRGLLRWSGYVAVAIVFAIACAFLSNWQFSRNSWRTDQLALVSTNYDATPVPFSDVIPVGEAFPAGAEWKPVTLQGRYLNDQQLFARNRAHGGTSAYEVLVPFLLDEGRVVLVDRGWVGPSDEEHAEPDPVPAAPAGESTVTVRLRPSEALPTSGRSAPAGQVPTINLPLVAEMIGVDGRAMVTDTYGALVSENPAPDTVLAALETPSEDPGPYLSYAIQWILFAVMGFVFIGYVIRTELRARREDAEDAAAADNGEAARARRATRAQRKRRDRDAAAEDALIDAGR